MSYAVKWLIRKCPNLLLVTAGAWFVFLALWYHVRYATNLPFTALGPYASLAYQAEGIIEVLVFVGGFVMGCIGLVRMIARR